MTAENLPAIVLLVLGILGLVKTVWGLASPSSFKGMVRGWTRLAVNIHNLIGIALIALAVALWVIVLLDQPLENWVLSAVGLLCVGSGVVYFHRDRFEKLIHAFILDRRDGFLRTMAVAGAVLSGLFVWVAIRGL